MKILKKGVLLLVLPLFAFTLVHKYYISVTTINYSQEQRALQVTTRIFIDDFEKLIEERYGVKIELATDNESSVATMYIEKYLRAKFVLKVDATVVDFNYIGKEYDDDVMVCYLEFPDINIDKIKSIEVQNEVLMDLFDEQKNIIHFKLQKRKKSIVLIRENKNGVLKL